MNQLKYSNIFEAIMDDPAEAAGLQFRADLMLVLREYFRAEGASEADIGKTLGVPQSRVRKLMRGKVDKFSADKLIGLLAKVGIRFKPAVAKAPKTPGAVGNRHIQITCVVAVSQAA